MIYLLRHGLDDERYIGGWSDASLTKEGINQVHEVGSILKRDNYHITKIYTSDIKRAVLTANIIKSYLKLEVIETNILRELNKGQLTGLKVEEARKKFPKYFKNLTIDTRYPEGESLKDLYIRVKILLETEMFKQNNILLITHRGIINMIYTILNNDKLDLDKKKYNVTHASLHRYDVDKKLIKKIR